jgi:hypothetical protein
MRTSATSRDFLAALATGESYEKAQVGIALLGGICAFVGIAYAQDAGSDQLMVTPGDLKWAPVTRRTDRCDRRTDE